MNDIISGLRVTAATMAICVAGYTTVILGFAQAVTPATANGSLITQDDGSVIAGRILRKCWQSAST
jgi:K+-transporting ATPase ATPase C chain